jgi:excisionase family DNA binding protein
MHSNRKTKVKKQIPTRNLLPDGAVVTVADVLQFIAQDGYLGKRAAASFVGLGLRTLEKHKGEIPTYKIGKRVLYRRSELIQWVERHRVPGPVEAASLKSGAIALNRSRDWLWR